MGYPCTFAYDAEDTLGNDDREQVGPVVNRRIFNRPFAMQRTHHQPTTATIDNLVRDRKPVFEEQFPVTSPFSQEALTYELPSVIANVVVVELIGKNTEQMPGSGYYACVEKLDCKGIPFPLARISQVRRRRCLLSSSRVSFCILHTLIYVLMK